MMHFFSIAVNFYYKNESKGHLPYCKHRNKGYNREVLDMDIFLPKYLLPNQIYH